MKRCLLQVVALLLLTSAAASAQTVTGRVTSAADGSAVPGASLIIKGTAQGTTTDADGHFTLNPSDPANNVLVVSFIGFATQEVAIQNRTVINISLAEDVTALGEVVVTALGIEKETKQLGYSVTNVKGEELAKAREINVGNVLVGKIAGVSSTPPSTGPGGSSRVVIRGSNSLSKSSQPLYIINGIQMNNQTLGSAGMYGGADTGDGLTSINPDDIQDITVLKGAAASALYGQRGRNGVILITTKSGKGTQGLGIEINSNTTFDVINNFTNWQHVYGQGTQGNKPTDAVGAMNTANQSWGAKLDGTMVPTFDGTLKPYSYVSKNNMKDFYQTGVTSANTVSISHGSEAGSIRFSAGSLRNSSVYRNSDFNRNSINLDASYKLSSKWSGSANINFSKEDGNRSNLSDSPGNGNYGILFLPPNMNGSQLAPGYDKYQNEIQYDANAFNTNPYFAANKFKNNTTRYRVLSVGTVRYAPTSWLYIQGRVANDFFTYNVETITPTGTAYRKTGSLDAQNTLTFNETNADFLVGINKNVNEDFAINATLGGNLLQANAKSINVSANGFSFPFLYNPSTASSRNAQVSNPRKEVQSLYGGVELSYKDMLFLNLTDRNDWSSALPAGHNSYNYSSVSTSFVFSELLKSDVMNFGKLRVGYAQVGGDTDAFQTALYYGQKGTVNGVPVGDIQVSGNSNLIPNSQLKPLQIHEFEIGANLQFLNNRIWVDAAYYNKHSFNDIVNGAVSQTSGYDVAVLNIGKIENKGIELLVGATPVKTADFQWTTSFNFTNNKNTVQALVPGVTENQIDGAMARTQRAYLSNIVGKPMSQVMAYDFMRDASGNLILNASGFPQAAATPKAMGTGIAPTYGGWNNEVSYKRFALAFLIDFKSGGVIYSGTNAIAYGNGLHKETLNGRETGIVVEGVNADGDHVSNTISAQNFYGALSNVSMLQVYKTDFVKFRSVSLTYTFPSLFNNKIRSLSISLVGRNLFYISKKTPNISPEANYQNGIGQGLEYAGMPTTKTFGVNLNAKF